MYKKFTNYTKAFLVIAIFAINLASSYSDSPRMVVNEHFTNSGCGPCAAVNPYFEKFYRNNLDYIIPIYYHTQGPDPTDPMYTQDINIAMPRVSYYEPEIGNGIPSMALNGTNFTSENTHINQGFSAITSLKGKISPYDMTVTYTLNGTDLQATVTITGSKALPANAILQVVLTEDYIAFNGNNGEKMFPWVARQTKPSMSGTPITLAANETKTFNFAFTTKSGWVTSNLQLVAFVQNKTTREIFQGVSTKQYLGGVDVAFTNPYQKIDPNMDNNVELSLKNNNKVDLTVTLSPDLPNSIIPNGWSYNLDVNPITIKAGQTVKSNAIINPKGNGGCQWFTINAKISDNGGITGLSPQTTGYILSTASKIATITSYCTDISSANSVYKAAFKANPTYGNYNAFLPFTDGVLTNFPFGSNFETLILPSDFNTRGLLAAAGNEALYQQVEKMIAANKNVIITSILDLFLSYYIDPGTGTTLMTPNANALNFFDNTMGINTNGLMQTIVQSGNSIQIYPATAKGVSGDLLGSKLSTLTFNGYNATTHPYYTNWLEFILLNPDSKAVPFLEYGPTSTNIEQGVVDPSTRHAAVYLDMGAGKSKIIYASAGLELLATQSQANVYLKTMLDWMKPTANNPVATISLSSTSLDFGATPMGTTATKKLTVSNTGTIDLVVSSIDKPTFYDGVWDFVGLTLPMTISAGKSSDITVSFKPSDEKSSFDDSFTIHSNDLKNSSTTVMVTGSGAPSTSTDPVITVDKASLTYASTVAGSSNTLSVTVSNTGGSSLTITALTWGNSSVTEFAVTPMPTLPMTLSKGQTTKFNIVFSPKGPGTFTNRLTITSNDKVNPTKNVDVTGTATGLSVDENGVAGDKGIFTMKAGPNPFTDLSTLEFNLNGTTPKNVKITMVDTKGSVLSTLVNSIQAPGAHSIPVNGKEISAGSYFLVGELDGYSTVLPIIIAK